MTNDSCACGGTMTKWTAPAPHDSVTSSQRRNVLGAYLADEAGSRAVLSCKDWSVDIVPLRSLPAP
ncbi:hypothetical protein BBK14_32170 [Parafrankia soli]|uniref:Uncharacterized protein n=1 Tax=Parafrankia soli TaxID=2599596 RepID=A0A1S1R6B9_9ACTN|nr:hypothetical protein BBK14_32170 [Parafrankia soli]